MKSETGFGNHSEKNKYILVVHQGDSVCTLMFTGLEEEVHLYNYGTIGHFWVKDMNIRRQLEYTLPLYDKTGVSGRKHIVTDGAETGSSGGFSTVELYLLSGNQQRISSWREKMLETSQTGFVSDGRTAEGNR